MSRRSPPRPPKAPRLTPCEVGYAKPPEATRFRPGQSGNPSGRPKGARNRRSKNGLGERQLQDIILAEAYRGIRVNEGDRQVTMPMAQAVVRSLAVNAAKGQPRAQKVFTDMVGAAERERQALNAEWLETAIEYKQAAEIEIRERTARGLDTSDILPHPDDIVIDIAAGQALVRGPMTKEDLVRWRGLRARLRDCEREIAELGRMLRDPENASIRRPIEDDLAFQIRMRDVLRNAIGDWDR